VGRNFEGGGTIDVAALYQLAKVFVEIYHAFQIADADGIGDLLVVRVLDQFADGRVDDHDFIGGDAAFFEPLDEFLGHHRLEVVGQGGADGAVFFRREQVENAVDGGARAGRVDGAEHEVARFGGVHGGLERFDVAQLADQDDIRVLADRVLEGLVPV